MTVETRNAMLADLDAVAASVRDLRRRVASMAPEAGEPEVAGKPPPMSTKEAVRAVVALVAATTNLPESHIMGRRGQERYCKARHASYWLVRQMTGANLCEIARAFNKKAHGTIINGCTCVEAKRSINPAYAEALNRMLEKLKNQKD